MAFHSLDLLQHSLILIQKLLFYLSIALKLSSVLHCCFSKASFSPSPGSTMVFARCSLHQHPLGLFWMQRCQTAGVERQRSSHGNYRIMHNKQTKKCVLPAEGWTCAVTTANRLVLTLYGGICVVGDWTNHQAAEPKLSVIFDYFYIFYYP